MRFHCTVYTRDYTFGAGEGGTSTPPGALVGTLTVSGATAREAAARAYVKRVGKDRARRMRDELDAPRAVVAQETNVRAIAACLRKMGSRLGNCYQYDNFVEAWFIHVEPVEAPSPLPAPKPSRLRRLRLPSAVVWRQLQRPSCN